MTEQADFDGAAYDPALDQKRLSRQIYRVKALMDDGAWRTLGEINTATNAPEASASACLRDFRKKRWGRNIVEKRRRGEPSNGLWEYRLLPPEPILPPFDPAYQPGLF